MFNRAWTALTAQKRRYGTPDRASSATSGSLIPISGRAERLVDPPAARLLGGQRLRRAEIGLAAQQDQHIGRLAAGQRLPHARIDRGRAPAGGGNRRSRGQRQPQETKDEQNLTKYTHRHHPMRQVVRVPTQRTVPGHPGNTNGPARPWVTPARSNAGRTSTQRADSQIVSARAARLRDTASPPITTARQRRPARRSTASSPQDQRHERWTS